MTKKKCDYCDGNYDEEYNGTLDNGSPACPDCVAKEQEKEDKE